MSRFNSYSAIALDDGEPIKAQVKWFNLSKGFGFVAPADGSPDAFLHISVISRAGFQELADGTELLCQVAPGPKGPQVTRIVEVRGGGAPAASGRGAPRGRPDRPHGADRHGTAGAGAEAGQEVSGTVKWFKPDKGFGFVTADDTSKDVFIHKSVLRQSGLDHLEAGERVRMKVVTAAKGREATWLALL